MLYCRKSRWVRPLSARTWVTYKAMSGLNGPHTQATGFNFSHSQLDSQPNYSFADSTQDGNAYSDYPEFSSLTQVSRSPSLWAFAASEHMCTLVSGNTARSSHGCGFRLLVSSSPPCLACCVQFQATFCYRTLPLKLPGMMQYKHLHWYGPYIISAIVVMMVVVGGLWQ